MSAHPQSRPFAPAAHSGPKERMHIIFTCTIAALAGLLFGLDIGVISGALPFIAKDFGVPDHVQEWIVSSMMVGAAAGALFSGWLASAIGRKYALVVGAILFIVGSAYCAFAWDPIALITGRGILGLAVGIASFTAPIYLSEIAPPAMRGAMISVYQLMVTVGILGAFLSNTAFGPSGSWRWMLGIIAFPAIALLVGVLSLPRSPRWLMSCGREAEAREVLIRLRQCDQQADREMQEISDQLKLKQQGWGLFLNNANFRRAVGLGVILQVMQQFTGINVVMYYAPRIFDMAGYGSSHDQLWGTVIVGVINVVATFIAIGLVDRWGRKPILYTGFVVMACGMGALATLLQMGINSPAQQIAAVTMLLIFIAGFAMSAGPLIWILCSEIQPIRGRDFGIAVSTFVNWMANAIAGATFLTLLNNIGQAPTFWIYAAMNAIFLVAVYRYVPETKAVSLELIERNLMAGRPLRALGEKSAG